MPTIRIAEVCQHSRVFREDGKRLREVIEAAWQVEGDIVLDFGDIRIASVSFLDEGIGVLALRHPLDQLRSRIEVRNIHEHDRRLLNSIMISRAREKLDIQAPSEYDDQPYAEQ